MLLTESDTEITQKMVGLGLLIENPEQLKVTKINKSLPPKVGSLMKVQIHGIVHDEDGVSFFYKFLSILNNSFKKCLLL